jgi:hypothetical protein
MPHQTVEKRMTDKVIDSMYLQPRWCHPGLTHTQKHKLQHLLLAEMREKKQEKQWDELFNEIKPMTLPKQGWKRKDASRSSTTELVASDQIIAPGGPTAAYSVTPPDDQIAEVQKAHGLTASQDDPTATPSSQRTEPGGPTRTTDGLTAAEDGQTESPGGPTASCCRTDSSKDVDGLLRLPP